MHMTFPRMLIPAFAALALVLAVAPAASQTREEVQFALERTDDLIARATEIVAGTDNPQAHDELAFAVRLQTDARAQFAAGRLGLALDLTRRARLRADRAIALVRGLPDPDRVLVQLERTRELLDRARERIAECDAERARAVLRAAIEMQARAEVAGREGRYLAALQLTLSARERALRALRMCNLEDNLREAAERGLTRTDDLIGRARDLLTDRGDEQARRALERAIEVQTDAWAQFRNEQLETSLRLTQSARTSAHRAIRLMTAR
jgi:tetratricopeptide (TPR) repeat protein